MNLINQAFKGQIKGLPQDHVVPQDQVLQIDKLKMFEKNQDQARSNTVDDEFKSRFRFTPKDAHRTGQDSTPPFPNRQSSPRHTLEDQVSGERRDVVNIHQQLKLKTLPITSKANH